jgi:ADP-ribose pyrophosphatase YjhB (NUDIX family)
MKFCCQCGGPVSRKVPPGDSLQRFVCDSCQEIHYQNPKIVVGCIPEWDGQVLLCRRAIEPRYGLWTFPAGFMEQGESLEEAVIRETLEEAETEVDLDGLYGVFSLPHVSQVYIVYRAKLRKPSFRAGAESLDAHLFALEAIPWQSIAFPVIRESLRRYVDDRSRGAFTVHVGVVAQTVVQMDATPASQA